MCTAIACKLPVGTESNRTACNDGEGGCTISVLQSESELFCTSGYNGSPSKANVVCITNGTAFALRLSSGTFCTGEKLAASLCPRVRLVLVNAHSF